MPNLITIHSALPEAKHKDGRTWLPPIIRKFYALQAKEA